MRKKIKSEYLVIATVIVFNLILHLIADLNAGFHGDELLYIESGRHLAAGYMDFSPMIAYMAFFQNIFHSSSIFIENTVSAYTTVNESADSMTVIIVNRDMNTPRNVTININGFSTGNGTYSTLELSALPETETFKSHADNGLKKNKVTVLSNSFFITVPALSTTAILLEKATTGISEFKNGNSEVKIFPNPAKDNINVSLSPAVGGQNEITVYDMMGRKILNSIVDCNVNSSLSFNISALESGVYFFSVKTKHDTFTRRFSVIR